MHFSGITNKSYRHTRLAWLFCWKFAFVTAIFISLSIFTPSHEHMKITAAFSDIEQITFSVPLFLCLQIHFSLSPPINWNQTCVKAIQSHACATFTFLKVQENVFLRITLSIHSYSGRCHWVRHENLPDFKNLFMKAKSRGTHLSSWTVTR